jgi:hypothetical protein
MVHSKRGIDTLMLTRSASTATQAANLDRLDASGITSDFATLRLCFHPEVNTSAVGPTLSVLEADTTDVTNFATIVADRTNEDLTTLRNVRYEIDCRKRKRYLRVLITPGTATANDSVTYTVCGTLTRKKQEPANETAQADVVVAV